MDIPWTAALADLAAGRPSRRGDNSAKENYRLLQEVAKDLRLTREMGQRFKRTDDGGIEMRDGQPVLNPNFAEERAAYINAPATAPSNPDAPPPGFQEVETN